MGRKNEVITRLLFGEGLPSKERNVHEQRTRNPLKTISFFKEQERPPTKSHSVDNDSAEG